MCLILHYHFLILFNILDQYTEAYIEIDEGGFNKKLSINKYQEYLVSLQLFLRLASWVFISTWLFWLSLATFRAVVT
jgi:hypothetical protein